MSLVAGEILVRDGKRWSLVNAYTCRRALFHDKDQLSFEWQDPTSKTDLRLTVYMDNGQTYVLGAPLILSPDGAGNFVVTAYGRDMVFSVTERAGKSLALYQADFIDGQHCQPDEGSDTDPDPPS